MYFDFKGLTKYNVWLVSVIGLEMLKNWPWGEEIYIAFSPHEKKTHLFWSHFVQKTEINPTMRRR